MCERPAPFLPAERTHGVLRRLSIGVVHAQAPAALRKAVVLAGCPRYSHQAEGRSRTIGYRIEKLEELRRAEDRVRYRVCVDPRSAVLAPISPQLGEVAGHESYTGTGQESER